MSDQQHGLETSRPPPGPRSSPPFYIVLITVVLIVGAFAVATRLLSHPSGPTVLVEDGGVIYPLGYRFAYTNIEWWEFEGEYSLGVELTPIDPRAQGLGIDTDLLHAMCGSILTSISARKEKPTGRSGIFRLTIGLRGVVGGNSEVRADELLLQRLPVDDGACLPVNQLKYATYNSYPAALEEWGLVNFNLPPAGAEDTMDMMAIFARRTPGADAQPPFQAGCRAVLFELGQPGQEGVALPARLGVVFTDQPPHEIREKGVIGGRGLLFDVRGENCFKVDDSSARKI
ncbi:MAG: hypothetical protein GYB51_12540 [Rhodobacteraceae bacterium]|nr:hypothetical protein [Paracoccaceae bacterium]